METLLKLASLMSENEDFIFMSIALYLQEHLNVDVNVIKGISWKERQQLLDSGEIDIAWICGLPYVLRANKTDPKIELLAAPVIRGDRYLNRPIYFSYVVVHRDSQFQSFADIQGASWAYNEPYSHSGYNVVRYHLATIGEKKGYFSKVIQSGAHLKSLEMLLQHQVDASAIDSIVLDIEFQRRPEIRDNLRIIEILGPSPIPPLVVSKNLSPQTRERLRNSLLQMEKSPSVQGSLASGQMARLDPVADSDYDVIRYMFQQSGDVIL